MDTTDSNGGEDKIRKVSQSNDHRQKSESSLGKMVNMMMLMIDVVISEREQQKNTAAQQQLHFGMPEVEAVCPEHCLWLGEEVSAVANLLAKKCRLRRLAECLNWRKHLFFVRFRLQQLPLPLSQIADRGNCTITSADYLKHGCFRHQ